MKKTSVKRWAIEGVELVTIPLADYLSLIACKKRMLEVESASLQLVSSSKGRIDQNPEVAIYLAQNFGMVPMVRLLKQCQKTFGKDRTPSKSAAYRYWSQLRRTIKAT